MSRGAEVTGEAPGDLATQITDAAELSPFFREFRDANRIAAKRRDELRDERRQRILHRMADVIEGGRAWTFDELVHEIAEQDRAFLAEIFPVFVAKLKGVYPEAGSGRLKDLDAVRHVMEIVTAERGRSYEASLNDRLEPTDEVSLELAAHSGNQDEVEAKVELAELEKMPLFKRSVMTLFLAFVKRAETFFRRARLRALGLGRPPRSPQGRRQPPAT